MIVTEGLRKTTRVTVCKYDIYQTDQQADNKQTTRRQQADNKQTTTTKEGIKNEKNEKKNIVDHTNDSVNFYITEVEKAKQYTDEMSTAYVNLCRHICQKKDGLWVLPYVLKIKTQISLGDFSKLYVKAEKNLDRITTKIDSVQSTISYHNRYDNLYLTINKWLTKD
jgi:hypothetical protein